MQIQFKTALGIALLCSLMAHAETRRDDSKHPENNYSSNKQHDDDRRDDNQRNDQRPGNDSLDGPKSNVFVFGVLDGVLSYCKTADPRDANKFRALRSSFAAQTGVSEDRIDAVTKDGDYRDGFSAVQTLIRGQYADGGAGACASFARSV